MQGRGKIKSKKAVGNSTVDGEGSFDDLGINVVDLEDESDDFSDLDDEYVPKAKDRNFEFTDSLAVMRLSRVVIFLQILSLVIDNPSMQLPIVFRILNRGPLFYVNRFYSRIVIDLVYAAQFLGNIFKHGAKGLPAEPTGLEVESPDTSGITQSAGAAGSAGSVAGGSAAGSIPGGVGNLLENIVHRVLSASSYEDASPKLARIGATADFLLERDWHSIKYFSHFFLSAFFVVMAVVFTLHIWEIKDYTDRIEVREWLREFIADGWWRRGLLKTIWGLCKCCFVFLFFVFGLFAVARELNVNSLPEDSVVGSSLAIIASILVVYWVIGYMALRTTEVTFVRYVSQNVTYTSSIILKRVVKSKVDIGLAFMLVMYMPALYIFTQSFFPIMDWNQLFASSYRKSVNFYVPCYYMAFPPMSEIHRDPGTCPVVDAISMLQPSRSHGFYRDRTILSCDSFLGVCVFTTGVFLFVFLAVAYYWLWSSFITTAIVEFRDSRFTGPLRAIISIRDEYLKEYEQRFNVVERSFLELGYEATAQLGFLAQGVRFLVEQPVVVVKSLLTMSYGPVMFALSPVTLIFNTFFSLCCESFTYEARKRKVRQAAREKRREIAKYKELTGEDFVFADGDDDEEDVEVIVRPIPQILSDTLVWLALTFNPFSILLALFMSTQKYIAYQYRHSHLVAESKLQWNHAKDYFCGFMQPPKATKGLISVGGGAGPWRIAMSLISKRAQIERLNRRVKDALQQARYDFISDHVLTITVFDRVIDSAGLFTLISQYHYHRLGFSILLWLEMTIYAVVAAVSNYFVDWQTRTQYLLALSCIFGFLTYLVRPFSEDCDRWFDFAGRVMVVITCGGILFCYSSTPRGKYDAVPAKMYDAQGSTSFLISMSTISTVSGLVDVIISLYMYMYMLYIVHYVGIFHAVSRKLRTIVYGMHDHILDFLIHKLEERTIGAENMYTGLMVVQQWDDIIREQRKAALLPWPDVRPPDVLPMSAKLIEIKWAAMFNLNVTNLRSSLGLSLLHTAMCNADGEVVRWIIHLYPELLNAEDFQRDTPIFIALKECAYFILRYDRQNGGNLEDGTSYRDEEFSSYYPEVDQYREEAADYGEYIAEFVETYKLDSIEVRHLKEHGYFVDTKDTDKANYVPTFRVFKSKLGKFATHDEIEAEKVAKAIFDEENKKFLAPEQELDPVKIAEAKKLQARKDAKALATERASLYRKRFPEDDFQDNHESGQMAAWKILGLDVPNSNLFIDPKTSKFHSSEFGQGEPGYAAQEQVEVYLDARYLVNSYNSIPVNVETVKNSKTGATPEVIPIPEGHSSWKEMQDWDYIRKKKRGKRSLLTAMADTKEVLRAVGTVVGFNTVTMAQKLAKDREVRYKLCKFAEIFLSAEILESVKVMKWDSYAYKTLNIMASREQGRIAQNLAMACSMNPPSGFTRISEWTMGISTNVFDEFPDNAPNLFMQGALTAGDTVKNFHSAITSVLARRGSRRVGQGPRSHGDLDYNRIGRLDHQSAAFGDRVIHYLAECLVGCRNRLQLSDCELSVSGRYGWRAIVRALRRNNCTFIMPSVFVGTKEILCTHLDLSRNELDCGDAVLLADVLLYKQTMILLDLSFNRIGSRGFIRMCKAMKGHENIAVLKLNHNRIGPVAGREIGILLKNNDSLRVMDLGHNRMGDLVRWPTLLCRERIPSAARDIFQGLRGNKSLEVLDLSYNQMGSALAECVPPVLMRHSSMYYLDISGNSLGPTHGPSLLFRLAGDPGGDLRIAEKERIEKECLEMIKKGVDPIEEMKNRKAKEEAAAEKNGTRKKIKKGKDKSSVTLGSPLSPGSPLGNDDSTADQDGNVALDGMPVACRLIVLKMANNQMGYMAGYGAAALATNSKSLTALDVSGNALGYRGGVGFADGLEKCFGLEPRSPEKLTLYKLDQQKYEGRDAIPKPLIYTNLISMNLARNGVGPLGCQGIMYCLAAKNCTITSLDISDNPLGYSIENGGDATLTGIDMRETLTCARSLTSLDISRTSLQPVEMVPILGGLSRNRALRVLKILDMALDEPSCLQLANGMTHCKTLRVFQLRNTKIGPKGALIIMNRVSFWGKTITYLDLCGNNIGPIAMIPLAESLADHDCSFKTLHIASNDVMDEGGQYIIKGLKANGSVTDLDISENLMTRESAEVLSDLARGLYRDGLKVNDCLVKKIVVSDNDFGSEGCRMLTKAFTAPNFQHVEMANCGAGASSAKIIAHAMRDVLTHWRVLDLRGNNLGRLGMNNIFWALRQNRSLRSLLIGENNAGPLFGSDDDALLQHGVAIQRALRANVVLRELDLSYTGIDWRGGVNIFEALVENYSIRKISLRGNVLDDNVHEALSNLFRYNDILEEVDLGENRMGYQCCYSIAEALECNRSVHSLSIDYNNLSAAGSITIEAFVRCLAMNTTLRTLIMDGNKLGSEWGVKLADGFSRNNTLYKVSLRDSRLDARAGMALLNAFKFAPFLLELAISADEVGADIWEQFRAEFARKRALPGPEHGLTDTVVDHDDNHFMETYYNP